MQLNRIAVSFVMALGTYLQLAGVGEGHSGIVDGYGCHRGADKVSYHCHQGQFSGRTFKSKEDFLRELRAGNPANYRQRIICLRSRKSAKTRIIAAKRAPRAAKAFGYFLTRDFIQKRAHLDEIAAAKDSILRPRGQRCAFGCFQRGGYPLACR